MIKAAPNFINFKKEERTDAVKGIWERIYPIFGGMVFSLLIYVYNLVNIIISSEKILDSTITFTSIIVGFVGALIGILFSIRDTDIINELFKKNERKILKKYFQWTVISGLLLVLISTILYLHNSIYKTYEFLNLNIRLIDIIFSLWAYLVGYFVLSTYRITDVMMYIIFKDPNLKNKEPDSIELEDKQKDDLKKRYTKKT